VTTGDLSIIVPAHNAAATLEAAIGSALEADGLLEVVVVDDGSTDDTLARANEMAAAVAGAGRPLLRVLSQAQAGPSAARNFGAANAKGRLLAFLDADDRWVAGVPDSRRKGLTDGRTVVLGLIQYYVGEPAEASGDPFEAFSACTALIPRDVFESVGPFEPGMDLGEDVDWFLRAREAGVAIVFESEVVLAYRSRPGSLSSRRADRGHGLLHALHRSVDRRRSAEEFRP
jgi:glycosyltransferase involved in cell wall biosynthesis